MKTIRLLIGAVIVVCLPFASTMALPAFPGAEGYGADVTGGRGGTVYHVTNLNDSGTGSLRNASAMSNVTIVFDVGGYINISSKLGFTGNNVTVAGQTAPGGIGIKCTAGGGISVGGDNIIFRHLYLRPGKASSSSHCLNINSNVQGLMVDHCSMNFSTDENNSMDNPTNVTIQWTTNAWGLQTHSCGALLYSLGGVTVHHGLWAHNHTRNPKHRNANLDWVNNTIFDWDIPFICADADSGTHSSNVVGCYFIAGANTDVFTSAQSDAITGLPTYHMYLANTLTDLNLNGVLDGNDKGTSLNSNIDYQTTRYETPQVTTDNALTAYKRVVSMSGAFPWARDEVDTLLFNDLTTQTRRIITTQADLTSAGISNGGFGTLGGGSTPPDTDQDGMPDYFETALGFNPSAADNNGDYDGDGYTNIEHYLNWLATPHAQVISGSSVDVGLRQFTSGFAATATYTVSDANHGTVTLLTDGKTAHFTPTDGYSGLAKFNFTVNDGNTATDTVTVLVQGVGSEIPLSPDPMTWASAPAAAGLRSITMTATTAISSGGVEYYFVCTAGEGHDSGWQTSATYVDSNLVPDATYTYRVKARDKIDTAKETVPSQAMSATTHSIPSLDAPAAHWLFDETSGTIAEDSIGDNNGTLQGSPLPTWTTGKSGYGNSLTFASTGQSVYVPSSPAIDFNNSESFSVSLWARQPASFSGQYELVIKGTIGSGSFLGSGKRYELYRKNSAFCFAVDDNSTKTEISAASSTFCTARWIHIVAVRDRAADKIKLYANGKLVSSLTDATELSISQTEPLYAAYGMYPGGIDDLRIYRYALSDDQIEAIYLGMGIPDETTPTPNPMTWAIEPTAVTNSSIIMTATSAMDISGVEYYFKNTTDPNHDSNWVATPSWTDTGLGTNSTYTYQVKARDMSANHNETGWSGTASAATLAWGCDSPIISDIDGDCQVNFFDFAYLADVWADNPPEVDLNDDEVLDFKDIAQFALDWLTCNRNPAEQCWQ